MVKEKLEVIIKREKGRKVAVTLKGKTSLQTHDDLVDQVVKYIRQGIEHGLEQGYGKGDYKFIDKTKIRHETH